MKSARKFGKTHFKKNAFEKKLTFLLSYFDNKNEIMSLTGIILFRVHTVTLPPPQSGPGVPDPSFFNRFSPACWIPSYDVQTASCVVYQFSGSDRPSRLQF